MRKVQENQEGLEINGICQQLTCADDIKILREKFKYPK
jgi:hypothetical protein